MQTFKLIYLFISTIWLLKPFVVSALNIDAPITDIMKGAYYDSRGNCTLKGIPGGPETRYRYDARNRLFAEKDAKMKNDGQWLIHHYDNLGRPAFSAYAVVSDAVIESLCAKAFTVVQGATTGDETSNDGGYKRPAELSSKLKYSELAQAHYYDSYNFSSEFKGNWTSYSPPGGFPTPRSSTAGLETATAAGRHILLKMYDGAGRIIREVYGGMDQWPERETFFRHEYNDNLLEQIDDTNVPQKVRRTTLNTYWSTGHLRNTTIVQNGDSARIKRLYDDGGRIKLLNLGTRIARAFSYNANGWLTSGLATNSPSSDMIIPDHRQLTIRPLALEILPMKATVTETLHYADEAEGVTPRYDGKISARKRDARLSTYSYDNHGRLEAAVCKYEYTGKPVLEAWDYSTSYSYDRNANITSLSRLGIVDKTIKGNNVFGLHSRYTMKYAVNRLASMEIEREGEDYEGRTGVGATGKISDFWYDANGNLGRDMSRGILETRYNHDNLPTDVYFESGHRQTIEYDGFGQKRKVAYSQSYSPVLGTMMGVPDDSTYTLQGQRDYIGPHVFVGDSLEYSAFPGGYFTSAGVFYYITDWQGNNIAVFSDNGALVQQTTYYPYGEPTIEPQGQRYLFGGKEREHAGGRNSYDYGPRNLGPSGSWDSADRLAGDFPWLSPFSYCGGDPINYIDPTGMIPTPYESALMSGASYHDENYKYYIDKLKGMNWVVSDFNSKICMNHPAGTGIGLQSMLFEKQGDNIEYAYVYAGTNSWEDAVEDLTQLVGISLEYDSAIENARTLHEEIGDSELTFIGHSMGGGNAAAASMATGRSAITFNPASVSIFTKLFYGLGSSDNITNYRTVPEGVGVGGCFVNNLQDNLGMRAPGQTIPIKIKSHNPFYAHKIEACIKYINKQ